MPPNVQTLFGDMNFNDLLPTLTIDMSPKFKFRRRSQCAYNRGCHDADLLAGDERKFFFVEYFDLWARQVNVEAAVDQRSVWLQMKQTAARQVR